VGPADHRVRQFSLSLSVFLPFILVLNLENLNLSLVDPTSVIPILQCSGNGLVFIKIYNMPCFMQKQLANNYSFYSLIKSGKLYLWIYGSNGHEIGMI
jgi:hypothetical protein